MPSDDDAPGPAAISRSGEKPSTVGALPCAQTSAIASTLLVSASTSSPGCRHASIVLDVSFASKACRSSRVSIESRYGTYGSPDARHSSTPAAHGCDEPHS
eukprot:6771969-Prymnesium_polylepis.1